jgi:hypothetical protein
MPCVWVTHSPWIHLALWIMGKVAVVFVPTEPRGGGTISNHPKPAKYSSRADFAEPAMNKSRQLAVSFERYIWLYSCCCSYSSYRRRRSHVVLGKKSPVNVSSVIYFETTGRSNKQPCQQKRLLSSKGQSEIRITTMQ